MHRFSAYCHLQLYVYVAFTGRILCSLNGRALQKLYAEELNIGSQSHSHRLRRRMVAGYCPQQMGSSEGEARNEGHLPTMALGGAVHADKMAIICSDVLDVSRRSVPSGDVGEDGPSGSPSMSASPQPAEAIILPRDAHTSLPKKNEVTSMSSEQSDTASRGAGLSTAGSISTCTGSSDGSPLPQQQPQQQKDRTDDELANRLGVALKADGCVSGPDRIGVNLHAALDLLGLPLQEMHLPLEDLSAFLPDMPEDCIVPLSPTATATGGQSLATDTCTTAEQRVSVTETSLGSVATVAQRQHPDECARRELVYAAKRFQRQRRLLLQQVRNRLLAALQQISDLQDAKNAAEMFLEELRQEVTAARAERQKARETVPDGTLQQDQQEQQAPRVYFDPLPPPSSEPLLRHPKEQQVHEASEAEASDTSDSFVGYEGSANVERLMQRYYATLIAHVDQAAKEHAKASAYSNGDGVNPGNQEGTMDCGSAGGAFASYYFDPFSVDQGNDASRRGQQGTGPSWPPLATAALTNTGIPNGTGNGQGAVALAARSHPMLSAAAEKVRGVAFCKSNRYWICTRMEHGKQQCRYFSVKHLGFECARREAILLRQQWKGDVNEEVLKALEEEKAAMDAAAAVPGGNGLSTRTRGAAEAHSPSLRPAPSVTHPDAIPTKTIHVGAGSDGAPPPRKEKTGEKTSKGICSA